MENIPGCTDYAQGCPGRIILPEPESVFTGHVTRSRSLSRFSCQEPDFLATFFFYGFASLVGLLDNTRQTRATANVFPLSMTILTLNRAKL